MLLVILPAILAAYVLSSLKHSGLDLKRLCLPAEPLPRSPLHIPNLLVTSPAILSAYVLSS